jgi:transposase
LSFARLLSQAIVSSKQGGAVPRRIGLDVHREFAQIAVCEDGLVRQAGQVETTPEALRTLADSLEPTDEVALEATCNTHAIVRLIAPRVARVVISNPMKTRAIAEAKVKTDKVDAEVLAQLLAANYLPAVWMPDERTQALRRQVARRAHIVRQRTRLKNQVQSILHRNLVPRPPVADLFGIKGRCWLANQPLPPDEQLTVEALLRQLDFHSQELRIIDAELGRVALEREEVKRLMTIPGVDATVALSIVAAVGDFHRPRGEWCPISGLTRACASPAASPLVMGASPSTAARTRAECSSKPPGRQPRHQARCAHSMNGSAPGAGCRSPLSPPRASSRCCAGI